MLTSHFPLCLIIYVIYILMLRVSPAPMTSIKFGCLLPVKIEGDSLNQDQETRLAALAESLRPTLAPAVPHTSVVYLGIDAEKIHSQGRESILSIFREHHIPVTEIIFDECDAGSICKYWRLLADAAVEDGCDFFGLLGDDVEMHSQDWISAVIQDFTSLHRELQLSEELFGFGIIAINDRQAPGFPTFPILHKIHYKLNGQLFDEAFVNQDADPFLFQLYRRWGASRIATSASLTNHVGGVQLLENTAYKLPRYDRKHIDWSNDLLTFAVERIEHNAVGMGLSLASFKFFTVDVIVPTYRVQRSFLEPICALKSALPNVSVIRYALFTTSNS